MKGIIWLWKHRRRQMHTSVGGKVEPLYPWPKRNMPRPAPKRRVGWSGFTSARLDNAVAGTLTVTGHDTSWSIDAGTD